MADPLIKVIDHGPLSGGVHIVTGGPQVQLVSAETLGMLSGSELELPELNVKDLGLSELKRLAGAAGPGESMAFAWHGTELDLGELPELLRVVQSTGTDVEIHVVPDPQGG